MVRRTILVTALIAGLVPMALAQLSSTDKTFVMKAAKANNYELKAAQLAQTMSTNDAYKQYANMITEDHTQAGSELQSIVASADPSVQLPTDVSATDQKHLDTLQSAGKSFDTTYRSQMISTHVEALQLFQNYAGQPNVNPQLKAFAQKLLPTLHKHLNGAKKLPKQ